MSIKVNISPVLSQYTNKKGVVELNGVKTVGECLNEIVKIFPKIKPGLFDKEGNLHSYIDVYVNGESSYPEPLAKPVKDKDELYIVFLIAGG